MDPNTKKDLKILGFNDDQETLPTMKVLTKHFYKLSMIHHPDRSTGKKETFQELLNAYHRVGDLIEQSKPSTTEDDDEEKSARDLFRKYNFEKENINTFTILLENSLSFVWDDVLTDNYGEPIDRTKSHNGKQWTVNDFKCENDDNVSSKVFLTKYHMPKSDKGRTKILVQAENCKQLLNISFVTSVLPILYKEVHIRKHQVYGS
jgi:curved DNA-binding protein CbpA